MDASLVDSSSSDEIDLIVLISHPRGELPLSVSPPRHQPMGTADIGDMMSE